MRIDFFALDALKKGEIHLICRVRFSIVYNPSNQRRVQ